MNLSRAFLFSAAPKKKTRKVSKKAPSKSNDNKPVPPEAVKVSSPVNSR